MPEIPSSILNPVISDDAVFAMQLDTKQRFDNVLSNFKTPISYPLPQYEPTIGGLNQYELLDNEKMKGSLGDALFDPDRRIADLANQKLNSSVSKLPTSYGIGVPERFPYIKEMDKYLNTRFGYDPYDTLAGNEEFGYQNLYNNKGFFGKLFNNVTTGVGRFLSSVALKLVQTVGYTGSMIWNGIEELFDPKGNDFMADVADNSLSRWAERAEQNTKNSSLLSVFKPADWNEKGFFQKMLSGPFWTDEVADGAAFMGEMIASTYLLGGLGKIAGLSKFGATPIALSSKLGLAGKGLDAGIKFLTGAQDISGIGRWAFMTASESAFEASQGYTDVKQRLQQERREGRNNLTDDEIQEQAGNSAASRFKANMLILSLSNAFENKMIFNPLFKRFRGGEVATGNSRLINISGSVDNLDELAKASRRTYNYGTKLGRFTDWKNPNSRLRFYGSRALASAAVEGFWEENAQLAAERLSANDALTTSSFFSQLMKQTAGALSGSDKEAAENIGLGALIGVGGVGAVSKIAGGNRWLQGERRAIEENVGNQIKNYEKYRKEFLSFNDIYQQKDGKVVVDEEGNPVIDVEKTAALMQGIKSFAEKQDAVDAASDPLLKKNIQHDAMADYVFAAKKAGVFNRSVSKFENLEHIDAKQLVELGFDPASTVDSIDMTNSMKEIGKIYEKAQDSKVSLPKNSAEDFQKDEQRKYALFKAMTRAYSASTIAQDYQAVFDQRTVAPAFSETAKFNTSDVQMFNSLVYQQEALTQFEQAISDSNNKFYSSYFKKEKNRLQNEIQNLAMSINEARGLSGDQSLFTDKFKYKDLVKYIRIANNQSLTGARDAAFDLENRNQIKSAELRNAATQNNYVVQKLSDPQNGYQNFDDYLTYVDSIKKKDEEQDAAAAQDNSEAGKLASLNSLADKQNMTDEMKGYVKDNLGLDPDTATLDEIKTKVAEKQSELAKTVTPQPVDTQTSPPETTATQIQKDVSANDSKDTFPVNVDEKSVARRVPDEVSADKPVSWEHANKTSVRDTNNVGADVEQLTNNEYDSMRADFIKRFVSPDFVQSYNFYIVQDNFPELYKGNKDSTGADIVVQTPNGWAFASPNYQGEVIVVEGKDGKRPTVKDFYGNKYKTISDFPVVFSFDKGKDGGAFLKDGWYDIRAGIKANKEGISIEDVKKDYEQEMSETAAAREFVRNNPDAKISIAVAGSTSGISPKTVSGSVLSRFGDFEIGISIPLAKGGTETQEIFSGSNIRFPKGTVFAKFTGKKFAFPVGTLTISQYPDLYSKIESALNYKFKTLEDAQRIRNDFLNVFVPTDKRRAFFRIDKEGENYVISFMKSKDADIKNTKLSDSQVRINADPAEIGQEYLNVSNLALKEGYQDFDSATGKFTFLEKEDYISLIKPKLITKLKKVIDQKGELYNRTVNPYFTFVIDDARIVKGAPTKEEIQNSNFEKYENRINQLKRTDKLNADTVKNSLATELKNQNITQAQHDSLIELIGKEVKIPDPQEVIDEIIQDDAAKVLEDKKADIERRRYDEIKAARDYFNKINSESPGTFPASDLDDKKAEINAKYDTELAALEGKNITVQKNNLAEKYKATEKKDISRTVNAPMKETKYEVEFKKQRILYIPQDNRLYLASGGELSQMTTGGSMYGQVLDMMEKTYPYSSGEAGNTGFAKLEVVAKDGELYKIYAPPTSVTGSQIVISPMGMVFKDGIQGLKDELSDEENKKLQDFINRYC